MRFSSLFSLVLPLVSLTALASPARRATPTVCNGHAELCDRSYGNVTFIGTHNSYGNGTSIMDNQGKGVVAQLNDGVRTLQVQAHTSGGDIHLCHSSCTLLDGGTLLAYLTKVKTWLDANVDEVITMVIVNSDTISPATYATAFASAGLNETVYIPTSATTEVTAWPTLGSMIESGQRMVVFMDYNADYTSVSWIIDEFSNMWEDAYDVTSQSYDCQVNRTSGSPSTTLYMTNHYLDTYGNILGINAWLPDKDELNVTNAETGYGSVGQGADNCIALWNRAPNTILLDFYDSNGNAPFNVAATLNGVSLPTNTVSASDISTGTSAEASSAATASTSTASSTVKASTSTTSLSGAPARFEQSWIVAGLAVAVFTLAGAFSI